MSKPPDDPSRDAWIADMRARAKAAGLVEFVPTFARGVMTEKEIARLLRLMREAGFTPEQIAEREGFWRRHLSEKDKA